MLFERQATPSTLDFLDRVLNKGIVIEYSSRVFLLGVDVLTTVDVRVIVASLDTHLKYGEALSSAGLIAGPMVPAYKRAVSAAKTPRDD
jgi:hypothetical protein